MLLMFVFFCVEGCVRLLLCAVDICVFVSVEGCVRLLLCAVDICAFVCVEGCSEAAVVCCACLCLRKTYNSMLATHYFSTI